MLILVYMFGLDMKWRIKEDEGKIEWCWKILLSDKEEIKFEDTRMYTLHSVLYL